MAVTIKDVAALAGVSPSTVSRVCNDHPSISFETRERVRQAMTDLGYEPGVPAAQNPPSLKLVGVILPPAPREIYEHSFYLEAIRGISQFCCHNQVGCTILTGKDDEELLQAVQSLSQSGQLTSFIFLYSKQEDPIVDYLCEQGMLYSVIGKATQLPNQTCSVDNDNLLAGREVTDYLYDLGHRRIAYLGCESMFVFSAERKSGYQLSLLQHGLPIRPEFCLDLEHLSEDGLTAMEQLLSGKDLPSAIVTVDDTMAVTLERVCTRLGLTIPGDVSIVSFNNSTFAKLSIPPLTSVEVNSFQLGYEAASQLVIHADNPNLPATKSVVPHRLVQRNSCREWTEA